MNVHLVRQQHVIPIHDEVLTFGVSTFQARHALRLPARTPLLVFGEEPIRFGRVSFKKKKHLLLRPSPLEESGTWPPGSFTRLRPRDYST